jgi:hypothetical protein
LENKFGWLKIYVEHISIQVKKSILQKIKTIGKHHLKGLQTPIILIVQLIKKQGFYYSWQIVNDKRGICPIGWHVPKDSEWKVLVKELKNEKIGIKLIENNSNHWKNVQIDTVNQNIAGFTSLPSGLMKEDGSFQETYTTS